MLCGINISLSFPVFAHVNCVSTSFLSKILMGLRSWCAEWIFNKFILCKASIFVVCFTCSYLKYISSWFCVDSWCGHIYHWLSLHCTLLIWSMLVQLSFLILRIPPASKACRIFIQRIALSHFGHRSYNNENITHSLH